MRWLILGLVVAVVTGACGGDDSDGVPEAELYGAAAEALVAELVRGDTVWFYETGAMTPEAKAEIESALGGFTVLFGPDWSEITSCLPAGPLPVTLSLGSASVEADSAEIPVAIDDPYAGNDATVTLALVDGAWQVAGIEYGPHGDKAFEEC